MALSSLKYICIIIFSLLADIASPVFAQTRNPFFKVTEVNLGVLPKDNKTAKANFVLTNNTKKVVSISSTKVSCSCTHIDYKKGLILPKDTTVLSVTVKTEFKCGAFEENILVRISPDNYPCILRVKGIKKYGLLD